MEALDKQDCVLIDSFRSLPSKARTVVSRFIQELSDNYPSIEQTGSLQDHSVRIWISYLQQGSRTVQLSFSYI
ncbi:hypothetical protein [Actinobacillus seminis]|uniref:hypothetical protein n=1 Tax=Actinobacillus seminis TaxID=722 RepID=UPI00130385C3|nr:hypothetical protein [Actinobacillus seminis]